MESKLRVAVRFDLETRQARLVVRGRVTAENSRVLYVLAKRANSALPGLGVVLDLQKASVAEDALAGFVRCSETGALPLLTGRRSSQESFTPGQLRILAPVA